MRKLFAVAALFVLSGCYHAVVETGRTPSGQTVEKPWANSFLYGLVPPATVETASKCPNGVAKVETQMSFLNMLASTLTGGLYTPMDVRVQCAAAGAAMAAPKAGAGELERALNWAAVESARTGEPAFVRF